jgi:hypothetical protein
VAYFFGMKNSIWPHDSQVHISISSPPVKLLLVVLAEPTRIGEPGCEFVIRDPGGVMHPVLGLDARDHERPFALGKLAGQIIEVGFGWKLAHELIVARASMSEEPRLLLPRIAVLEEGRSAVHSSASDARGDHR